MTDDKFDNAFKKFPDFIGGLDPLADKTVTDLVNRVQFEIDLYEEGEDSDIKNFKHMEQAKKYIREAIGL